MTTIRLDLGGTPISLPRGSSVTWGLHGGVDPLFGEIETDKSRALEIMLVSRFQFPDGRSIERGTVTGPLALSIRPSDGPERNFRNLYLLTVKAGSNPKRARLVISDARYWWRYSLAERAWNVRRSAGNFRLVGGELVPVSAQDLAKDYIWRRASLRAGIEPYSAEDALREVMDILEPGNYEIPPGVIRQTDWTDGVSTRDSGRDALARVLTYLPGVYPYQTESGSFSFANVYDGSEAAVVSGWLGKQNAGSAWLADRRNVRPRLFRVYFPREVELRLDFIDVGGEADPGGTQIKGREPLGFENVIPCPLYSLTLPGGGVFATLGQWIPLPIFIACFNLLKGTKDVRRGDPLSQQELREAYLGRPEILREDHALLASGKAYDPDLELMLAALLTHWRSTFRIYAAWIDRVRGLSAVRAAITDPENGTRARAGVFCEWIEKYNQQALSQHVPDLGAQHNDWAADLSGAKASPFEVQILDADAGVFTIVPRINQSRVASDYVIGRAKTVLPTANVSDFIDYWHGVTITSDFKLAVVLSATIDAPNDERRLHCELVQVGEAADQLGAEPGECLGPELELAVSLDSARHAWVDTRSGDILAAVYGDEGATYPADLMTNLDTIKSLAVAAASTTLAPMLDRVQGRLVLSHAPKINPTGNLKTVLVTVSNLPNGHQVVQTLLDLPGDVTPPNVFGAVAVQVRRVLRGEVQP